MLVGVLGGGQLGRMLALAGYPLGLRFRFLDPSPAAPARQVADLIVARHDDPEALARFTEGLDVATWEFEDLPGEAVEAVAARVPMHPPPTALAGAQDRWTQRQVCAQVGLPMPACRPVSSREELAEAVATTGLPSILKTRRSGYDGKGQAILRSPSDLDAAWKALGGQPLILEALIPFGRELSIIAVRDVRGATAFYPLTENRHEEGILRSSVAPAPDAETLQASAEDIATRLLDHLRYVGVMTVELFEVEGRLLVNEVAMRVHNSGHWTIEGAPASQFENHLRAICGWPLGLTHALGHCAMLNLIGHVPPRPGLLAIPGAHVHLYGKDGRPNRKIGHVTVMAATAAELEQRLRELESRVRAVS